jgi:hypothetical protein
MRIDQEWEREEGKLRVCVSIYFIFLIWRDFFYLSLNKAFYAHLDCSRLKNVELIKKLK